MWVDPTAAAPASPSRAMRNSIRASISRAQDSVSLFLQLGFSESELHSSSSTYYERAIRKMLDLEGRIASHFGYERARVASIGFV